MSNKKIQVWIQAQSMRRITVKSPAPPRKLGCQTDGIQISASDLGSQKYLSMRFIYFPCSLKIVLEVFIANFRWNVMIQAR